MTSFKIGKNIFIINYIILEVITIILLIATFPMLAEYGSSPSIIQELSVLIGILFGYALFYLLEIYYGFKIQHDEIKIILITLSVSFLLNVFTTITLFEYVDLSVLHGSNLGFLMYKTYTYIFILLNLAGFGANLYLISVLIRK